MIIQESVGLMGVAEGGDGRRQQVPEQNPWPKGPLAKPGEGGMVEVHLTMLC